MRAVAAGRVRRAAAPVGAALLGLIAAGVLADAPDMPDAEIVSPSRVGEVIFPHALHAEEMGFECSECHHEMAATALGTFHAEYFDQCRNDCASCHREGSGPLAPQSCSRCHPAVPTSMVTDGMSAKVAIHRSCWNCHDSGTGAEATSSCGFCHTGLPSEEDEIWTAAGS